MGGASSNQYSRVTNAVMIEAAAAITSNNDSAATIVFFDLLLSRPDHSAAASGSTPTLKLRIATAACNCSKSSNGNPAISATVSAWGERVRCTDFALVISNRGGAASETDTNDTASGKRSPLSLKRITTSETSTERCSCESQTFPPAPASK